MACRAPDSHLARGLCTAQGSSKARPGLGCCSSLIFTGGDWGASQGFQVQHLHLDYPCFTQAGLLSQNKPFNAPNGSELSSHTGQGLLGTRGPLHPTHRPAPAPTQNTGQAHTSANEPTLSAP